MLRSAVCMFGFVAIAAAAALAQPAPTAPTVPARRPGDTTAPPPASTPTLLVGDRAPDLLAARWVKGSPVEKFEPGRFYIVEFWASWCKPCAASIPRLSDLQTRFKDRGLTVIGMASQEVAAADLDRSIAAQGDRITYAIALDNNGATHQRWMIAAGQDSIPTAFLVDAEGRIAWIGHPLDGLEEATIKVLDGKFDLPAAAAAYRAKVERLARAQPTIDRFREHLDSGEHAEAIVAADELLAMDPGHFGQYAVLRFQVMAFGQKDYPGAYKYAARAIEGVLADNADALALLASTICDDPRLEKRDFSVAGHAAARADTLTEGRRADVAAALARVAAESGDYSRAVELQGRAVRLAGASPIKPEMERRLADYRARADKPSPK